MPGLHLTSANSHCRARHALRDTRDLFRMRPVANVLAGETHTDAFGSRVCVCVERILSHVAFYYKTYSTAMFALSHDKVENW